MAKKDTEPLQPGTAVRLDKWLWCARFFRTRAAATSAVRNGRVRVRGQRTKPAQPIRVGDELCIQVRGTEFELRVQGLARTRQSATLASHLYLESLQGRERRRRQESLLRSAGAAANEPAGRPDRRQRRHIIRFRRSTE